jgi:hypothetical protein
VPAGPVESHHRYETTAGFGLHKSCHEGGSKLILRANVVIIYGGTMMKFNHKAFRNSF